MKKLITAIACSVLLLFAGAPLATAATTQTEPAKNDQAALVAEVGDVLEKFGVPADKRESLIADYLAGIPWDSFESAAEPESVEQRTIDGFEYTVLTYPDGSFRASGFEVAREPSEITPYAGITGCSFYRSGGTAYYNNCTIRETVGVVTGDFRADYRMNSGANTAQITDAFAPEGRSATRES